MNIATEQKGICREVKKLVTKIEDNIDKETRRIEIVIEASERPAAGVMRRRPNSAHNFWIGGLRAGWHRTHNY